LDSGSAWQSVGVLPLELAWQLARVLAAGSPLVSQSDEVLALASWLERGSG
jgi:hypothetical protein